MFQGTNKNALSSRMPRRPAARRASRIGQRRRCRQTETPVRAGNRKRLTAAANRLIIAPDERSLQTDLVSFPKISSGADWRPEIEPVLPENHIRA
jgi:hypothetical protein